VQIIPCDEGSFQTHLELTGAPPRYLILGACMF
jgi:hypothetical protein